MPRCPCKSRRELKRCCGPILAGRPAPDPEALMRSRFSAYALGQVDHILDTTDPDGPQWQADRAAWAHQVQEFSRLSRFVGLRILEAPPPGETEGFVSFHADLAQGGMDVGFIERSRFTRCNGQWKYHSGEKLR